MPDRAADLHHDSLRAFHSALVERLEGECDFSAAGVALYTSDASNYRQVPFGVVYPRSVDDIVLVNDLCREHGLALLMRGGGTSQNGQCVNEAVVVDCSRHLNRVRHIDVEARVATVEPGTVCDALKAAAEVHGLTFGPDPATHSRCTLGGMIGNNSCGPHSMLAGKTVENVLELEVLTADGARFRVGPTSEAELEAIIAEGGRRGEIHAQLKALRDEYATLVRERYPGIKRRVSGYNLDQLLPENGFDVARALVGSEGTCVSVLEARVRLIENPAYRRLIVLGFADIFDAGDAVPEILPFSPIAMEGIDWGIVGGLVERGLRAREIALLPEGRAWLLIEIAASDAPALAHACTEFTAAMRASHRVRSVLEVSDAADVAALWSIREQGASATSMSLDPNGTDPVVGWEDTAVDPLRLGDYLREFHALVARYGYTTNLYGHFGDGCIHARITFDTRSADGVARWRAFSEEIAKLVVRFGGSLSGEHGDGQAKAEFLPIMFGEELMDAFRRFKAAWDPERRMNPGKLIDAYRMDEHLRFGPDYVRPSIETTLVFAEDPAGFGRSSERCIGMGKCRAHTGSMCPSYQASGEERYSTRGRAHLLHELVRGEVVRDGWDNAAIADSLEHCLSCKACKSQCPTKVDIAAYKAEFMSKHYRHRRRPLAHHALGRIGDLLPWMARAATPINALLRGPLAPLARRAVGFDAAARFPALARESFAAVAKRRAASSDEHFHWFGAHDGEPVVLWADSLNAHYRPQLLDSALRVLDRQGFRVGVAREHFCCGRPLFDVGFLDEARARLGNVLSGFHAALPPDARVIVLESSCLSVFRDELLRLYPDDARAADLAARTSGLAAFLSEAGLAPSTKLGRGVMHLHCHNKALGTETEERAWMQACFERIDEPEEGCCGMAGSFGLRAGTRVLAERLYARRLAPAIEAAIGSTGDAATLVADGFSCREQLGSHAGRTVLHPVEVIERCL